MKPNTLLSLASRQIWPQILTVAHLKPDRLVLLHSNEKGESARPAERLADFYRKSARTRPAEVVLREVPSDDFDGLKCVLTEIRKERDLSPGDSAVHFTGGNKLMATAAYDWAREHQWPACYLERGLVLFQFQWDGRGPRIESSQLDPHLVGDEDAISLLRAQLDEAHVLRQGERLALNRHGETISLANLGGGLHRKKIRNSQILESFRRCFQVENPAARGSQEGDALEYAAALAVLRAGIPVVHRGVELAASPDRPVPQSEIDLIFNWKGRLWMVDCKSKTSGSNKLKALVTEMRNLGLNTGKVEKHLQNLKGQIADTEARLLKEDIQQISEMGGLLGSAIAVRLQGVSNDVLAFALSRRPKVEIVYAAELFQRFEQILR